MEQSGLIRLTDRRGRIRLLAALMASPKAARDIL
jgi:hypothetical protein